MKRFLAFIGLLLALFASLLMLTHYFPEKVPKNIATAIPEEYYRKVPRQVREYFPWLKPKEPEKPMAINLKEINDKINQKITSLKAEEEEAAKKKGAEALPDILQGVLEDFYQKLAENQANDAYGLLHSASQKSLSGDNFVNYYSLISDTFDVTKLTLNKNITTIPEYKDPVTKTVFKPLIIAKVTFNYSDHFTSMKSISDTVTKDVYFAQENSQWKIVELGLNDANFKEQKYYYFINEGFKRLQYKDTFGAIDFFRQAIQINDLSLNANYGLSVAYYSIAYYDQAIKTVQKMESIYHKKYVTKLVTDNIDLKTVKKLDNERLSNGYYMMALALIKKGNLAGAKDALYKSLALVPNNQYAQDTLKTIPQTVAAKPAPQLYVEDDKKDDPFKEFKAKQNKSSTPASGTLQIDPQNALELLQNR